MLNGGVEEERGSGRGPVDPTYRRKVHQVASRCGLRTHAIPIRRRVDRTTTLQAEWRRIPCREPRRKEQLKNKTKPWNHIRSYKTSGRDESNQEEGLGGERRVDRYHGRELRRRGAVTGARPVRHPAAATAAPRQSGGWGAPPQGVLGARHRRERHR